ncbi:MAG: class I SAM-dependent methyltransferase [Clostridiales bacterium]|nr:class I SAM-dependent methyltransferase [Clostridiales bacterium]
MSKRLDLIKSLIIPSRVIADVGCDHGLIAEYCTAKAERVIASDISEKCLDKARLRLAGATNVTFVCCDGLGYECDEAIISGMGGILIAQILRAAERLPKTLILSPHRDGALVRSTLIELGYGIDRDIPIYDRNKFYYVIRADKAAGVRELSHLQTVFGVDCATSNADLRRRLAQQYSVLMRAPQANKQQLSDVTAVMRLQSMQP